MDMMRELKKNSHDRSTSKEGVRSVQRTMHPSKGTYQDTTIIMIDTARMQRRITDMFGPLQSQMVLNELVGWELITVACHERHIRRHVLSFMVRPSSLSHDITKPLVMMPRWNALSHTLGLAIGTSPSNAAMHKPFPEATGTVQRVVDQVSTSFQARVLPEQLVVLLDPTPLEQFRPISR